MENTTIKTNYDDNSGAFVIRFPEYTTFAELKSWGENFRKILLKQEKNHKPGLLLDTNSHNFESISCLKFLRNFLQEVNQMDNGISKVAFVQPVQYRQPEIMNSCEAYFSKFEEAYQWLRK